MNRSAREVSKTYYLGKDIYKPSGFITEPNSCSNEAVVVKHDHKVRT